ncbi:phosphonate ABC transporter, permease protein PhnE [Acidisoma cellulosilytica]|uniref:Phosphonate ABC transporter, permease protein PhnE n=1 Tax=Acidisoma cellulosilyticum TaxID=2802395 RepID=A0A964E3S8_9PROT|nr:phosphonate ABC transporter, permease protein PhnE [Acidisoma cellulosilyticum]MCB8880547.1 phosphonate ABC transporter, permease protein PhnE [Acidisoma cellulosilyticum]
MNGFALKTVPAPSEKGSAMPRRRLNPLTFLFIFLGIALFLQSAIVVHARPQDLITGAAGIADILRRSFPPDFAGLPDALWPALETIDMGLFGTAIALVFALPVALLAARNTTPAKPLYFLSRGLIALARVVPDLVWALIFVTAVGLGPFPGALAIVIHSLGMMGRLFAETIEDIDMGPVEALTMTGAGRLAVFSHAVVPTVMPSLLGITLYRLDENIRSSLILGFVGAGGIGFQLLTAMNLFQYRTVSMLLILTFIIVVGVERISAALRQRIA